MNSKKGAASRSGKTAGPEALPKQTNIPTAGSSRLVAIVCLILAVAATAVYARTFHFGFVAYDDDQYVYENQIVRSGLSVANVVWAITAFHYANWHPLTWISYLLDAQIFGINAGPFHAVNVLLHAASTALLFLAFFRMTRRLWPSAVVAAVFALHPLHVESVAWISERKDVLSTFLAMMTLLAYLRYTGRTNLMRYLVVCVVFALSLMAKPMMVTFPFVLLLLDYWPLQRLQWPLQWQKHSRVLLEKIPMMMMSLAASALTIAAQRSYGAVASLEHVPLTIRIENALIAYVAYIKQSIWPVDLAALYPPAPPDSGLAIFAFIVLLAVTALVLVFARSRPYWFIGWLWFLGMLVPVIGIVQVGVQSRADRYMYLPLVGLTTAFVWTVADWIKNDAALQRAAAVVTTMVLLTFGILTWLQAGYWKDSRTLFEHTLAVTDRNAVIRNNFGVILAQGNDTKGAIDQYKQALDINPEYPEAHANLGHELLRAGQFDAARSQIEEAVRLKPGFAMALADLGLLDAAGGNYPNAIRQLQESLRLAPGNAEVHSNLCFALQHAGRRDEAISECREALRLKPGDANAQFNLNNALSTR